MTNIQEYKMNSNIAYITFHYDLLKNDYIFDTNMKFDGVCKAFSKYMTEIFNTKKDESKGNTKAVYKIVLSWFKDEDFISIYSDTGNKNLENYLLFDIWRDFLG